MGGKPKGDDFLGCLVSDLKFQGSSDIEHLSPGRAFAGTRHGLIMGENVVELTCDFLFDNSCS